MNELKSVVLESGRDMKVLGIISIALGVLAMLTPGLTGLSVALLLGGLVLGGGVVRILWAFRAGSFGRGLLTFAIGALTILCGLMLIGNPLFTSGVITILLAVYFIADGVVEIAAGIKVRPVRGWGWMLFGGIVSISLGLMIWRQFPLSGLWAMGILLGIKLFVIGIIMLMGGSALKSLAKAQ